MPIVSVPPTAAFPYKLSRKSSGFPPEEKEAMIFSYYDLYYISSQRSIKA